MYIYKKKLKLSLKVLKLFIFKYVGWVEVFVEFDWWISFLDFRVDIGDGFEFCVFFFYLLE